MALLGAMTSSPDSMDAMNLAYYEGHKMPTGEGVENERKSIDPRQASAERRRGMGLGRERS